MEWLMCRSCGEFVRAKKARGTVVPLRETCRACGEMEFKHNASGRTIRTDEE